MSTSQSVKVGEMVYLSYTIIPTTADIVPDLKYDGDYISCILQNSGIIITGIKEGQTPLTISYGNKSATCIINISGYSDNYASTIEPYIYSNTNILQMTKGESQRIYVSLYNGDVSDIENYTWTVDNTSTISLSPSGQYCIVKALEEGYSRIKVTNPKASYPYYIGVYVFTDPSKSCYITTTQNIVTLRKKDGDKLLTVDVINPEIDDYYSSFTWNIVNDKSNEDIISIVSNNNSCIVTPLKQGTCTLRVSNEKAGATYPLDIIIRVIEIVDNVYIEPSDSIINLYGNKSYTLSVKLIGVSDYSDSDFEWQIEDNSIISGRNWDKNFIINGLKNGVTSIYVSHPYSKTKRQILVFVDGFTEDYKYIDTSCYITTSQNYIKTKVGAEDTILYVNMIGGDISDKDNYVWTVKHNSLDGSSNVINLQTTYGNVNNSRAASTIHNANAIITPISPGTATITVSNTKCYYSTDILVKVLPKESDFEHQMYFSGKGIIQMLNSDSTEYFVNLINGNEVDNYNITWKSDNPNIVVRGNGNAAIISSNSNGINTSYITISHPNVEYEKKVLVLTADSYEDLFKIKAFYSDSNFYSLKKGSYINIEAIPNGFYDENDNVLDFTTVSDEVIWTSSDEQIATVKQYDSSNPLLGCVTGLKEGSVTITVSYKNIFHRFHVVVESSAENTFDTDDCYFTTNQNVINIPTIGTSKTVNISAVGLSGNDINNITWNCENTSICSVISNGTSAFITGLNGGDTKIRISHPKSVNELTIYVRVGSEYIIVTDEDPDGKGDTSDTNDENNGNNNEICYITTSQNYIKTKVGAEDTLVTVTLKNGINCSENDFIWTVEQNPVVENTDVIGFLTPTGVVNSRSVVNNCYGKAIIEPKNEGTATITVSHPESKYSIQILVKVLGKDSSIENTLYFTGQNILKFLNNEIVNYSILLNGLNKVNGDENAITWSCDNPDIVVEANGTDAIIYSKGHGKTISYLTISHPKVEYDKSVLIITADSVTELNNSKAFYTDKTSYNINVKKTANIIASAFGFSDTDFSLVANKFVWESSNPSVAYVERSTDNPLIGIVKGLKVGSAKITLSYLSTSVSATIYVYPEDVDISNISDAVDDKDNNNENIDDDVSTSDDGIKLKLSSDEVTVIAKQSNGLITFFAEENNSSYIWLIDGLIYNTNSNIFELNISDYVPGQYEITLITNKNGINYSVLIQFSIK